MPRLAARLPQRGGGQPGAWWPTSRPATPAAAPAAARRPEIRPHRRDPGHRPACLPHPVPRPGEHAGNRISRDFHPASPDGKVVFIDGARCLRAGSAPACTAEEQLGAGTVTAIRRESSQQVRPVCPHFGCTPAPAALQMQHHHAAAQVTVKQQVLEDNLWHLGRSGRDPAAAIEGPTWGYRYRARLSVRYVPERVVLIGFHERTKSRYVADIRSARCCRRGQINAAAARADLQPGRDRDLSRRSNWSAATGHRAGAASPRGPCPRTTRPVAHLCGAIWRAMCCAAARPHSVSSAR